jgi:molybdopterin converting factor small subunit
VTGSRAASHGRPLLVITITVRFVGGFRVLAGGDHTALSLPHATLSEALRVLRDKVPQRFVEEVLDPVLTGTAEPTMILHNREPVRADLSALHLQDGDVVAFVPPMAGG